MLAENVGKYLRSLRLNEGITQRELAAKMNVTHQAVSRWENGKSIPDVDTLRLLGEFYGVSMDEILQVENGEKKKDSFLDKHGRKLAIIVTPIVVFPIMYYYLFFQHIAFISVYVVFVSIAIILLLVFLKKYFRIITLALLVVVIGLFINTRVSNPGYYNLTQTGFLEEERYEFDHNFNGEIHYEITGTDNDEMIVIQYEDHESIIRLYNLSKPFEEMMTEYEIEDRKIVDLEVIYRDIYMVVSYEANGTENFELLHFDYTDGSTTMLLSDEHRIRIFNYTTLMVYLDRDRSLYTYHPEEEW